MRYCENEEKYYLKYRANFIKNKVVFFYKILYNDMVKR